MLLHQIIHQKPENQTAFLGSEPITYGELKDSIARYRVFFYQQGIHPKENVGLFSKNSAEFVVISR